MIVIVVEAALFVITINAPISYLIISDFNVNYKNLQNYFFNFCSTKSRNFL